ncbi:MAG TPA: MarR family transcriptional regulator [Candidatus Limnocylindrales bacterium]|jgi:DNA-binding MarR family transcriptional regulator
MNKIQMPDDFYDQTPEGNVLATEAVMNTIRTADLLFDQIGRLLRPLNVSAAGGLVLGILRDHGPMSPSTLSDRLIVTRATVTGVLDSLERRGFVVRSANPADRRGQIAEITPAGLAVLQELRTLVHRHEKAWAGVLDDEELRTYIGLLHRIQDSVASLTAEGD